MRKIMRTQQILIDIHEEDSEIREMLTAVELPVVLKTLKYGDIIIIGKRTYMIERKTVEDFLNSLRDKRIFRQLFNVSCRSSRAYLIIEGNLWETVLESEFTFEYVYSFIAYISASTSNFGMNAPINVIETKNPIITSIIIRKLYKMAINDSQPIMKPQIEGKDSRIPANVRMLAQIPGIGQLESENLLKYHGTLRTVLNSTEASFIALHGFGKKRYEKLQHILDEKMNLI